jgi:hypothetical protein
MTTTKDEAMKRAFEAKDARRDFLLTHSTYDVHEIDRKVNAAFLTSLRESGWTLAPVEATLKMQHAYFTVIDKNLTRVETDPTFGRYRNHSEAYREMMLAAQEDESNDR